MRWESLFDDLARRFEAMGQQERENDIREMTRYENAQVTLHERLRASLQQRVRVWFDGQASVTGLLNHVGSAWITLNSPVASHMIVLEAISMVEGLPARARTETSQVELRLGLPSALREIAAQYQPVLVRLTSGREFIGMMTRVGRDYVEFAPAMSEEKGQTKPGMAVPFSSLACITSK